MTHERLRDIVVSALRPYASRIAVFGSWARGEAGAESDVDVLITLRPPDRRPPMGLRWFELEQELSEQLGRPVELVIENALSQHLQPHVEADRVVLYEEEG